jgi:hypothetical protein
MADNPYILFLQETKCPGIEADTILSICWRHGGYVNIDSRGSSGGLSILWNPTIVILDQFFTTKWTIYSHFRGIGSDKEGYVTNVYGLHVPMEKSPFLENLVGLKDIIRDHRWILGGEFNIILSVR